MQNNPLLVIELGEAEKSTFSRFQSKNSSGIVCKKNLSILIKIVRNDLGVKQQVMPAYIYLSAHHTILYWLHQLRIIYYKNKYSYIIKL